MVLSLMVPIVVMEVDPVIYASLMKLTKNGLLLLDRSLESKDMSNYLCSIKERGKVERRTLDALRGRRGLMPVRSMKPNLLISLSKKLLSLSPLKDSFQGTSLRRLQST